VDISDTQQNVTQNQSECDEILENVFEFPGAHNFPALMQELGVELEPVDIGSALFLKDGTTIYLDPEELHQIQRPLTADILYARSAGFWMKTRFSKMQDF